MILEIVKYGQPVLRRRGARIETITSEIRQLAADMIETMHASHGVGLAAQQVNHALQLLVIDIRDVKDRPSTLEVDGKPADADAFMPLVLINPELNPAGARATGPEGCLSFPEMFAEVTRPGLVEVTALNENGERLAFRCGGLLGRAIQHEHDHLRGILFIDRMSAETLSELQPQLDTLQSTTKARLQSARTRPSRRSFPTPA